MLFRSVTRKDPGSIFLKYQRKFYTSRGNKNAIGEMMVLMTNDLMPLELYGSYDFLELT